MYRIALPMVVLFFAACGNNVWGRCANDPSSTQPMCTEYHGGSSSADGQAKVQAAALCNGGGFVWEDGMACDLTNTLGGCQKDNSYNGTSTYQTLEWFYPGVTFTTTSQVINICAKAPAGTYLTP